MNETAALGNGGGKSDASLDVEAQVYRLEQSKNNVLAFASITLGKCFVVQDLTVVNGSKGPFVSMPRGLGTDKQYHDIRYPVTEKMYHNVTDAVMEKFQAGTPPTKVSEREKPDSSLTLKVSATASLPEAGNTSKNLLAHVSVVIGDCFAINDVRVMKGKDGPFMALPSKKNAKTGEYHHTCFPATKQMWNDMNTAVMGAYQRAMERSSVRGAVQAVQREAAARPPQQAARTAQRAAGAR